MRFLFAAKHTTTHLLFTVIARKDQKVNSIYREETIGKRIRAARMRMGMTQEELAEIMCTTKSMISYYENDHGDMKQSLISEIADILNTTVEYLVCGVISDSGLDEDTKEVISLFKKMDTKTKEILLIQMRALARS